MRNIIDIIDEEMQSDEENRDRQSEILENHYKNATKKGKGLIDDVLLCLCGWSFRTLKEKMNEPVEDEEEDNG